MSSFLSFTPECDISLMSQFLMWATKAQIVRHIDVINQYESFSSRACSWWDCVNFQTYFNCAPISCDESCSEKVSHSGSSSTVRNQGPTYTSALCLLFENSSPANSLPLCLSIHKVDLADYIKHLIVWTLSGWSKQVKVNSQSAWKQLCRPSLHRNFIKIR